MIIVTVKDEDEKGKSCIEIVREKIDEVKLMLKVYILWAHVVEVKDEWRKKMRLNDDGK